MSAETEELVRICDALPQEKRNEVADFARFLLARESDEAWERTLDDPRGHPKLDAFVKSALVEGSEPLDLDRLAPRKFTKEEMAGWIAEDEADMERFRRGR